MSAASSTRTLYDDEATTSSLLADLHQLAYCVRLIRVSFTPAAARVYGSHSEPFPPATFTNSASVGPYRVYGSNGHANCVTKGFQAIQRDLDKMMRAEVLQC